jgi:teichuronic acid biosynthesis glycosyltransferase TuaH
VVATHLADFLGYWGRDVVNVLYGTDDYVAGAELMGLSASYVCRQERRAVSRADVVAVVSSHLAERWTRLGANPILIPNGCILTQLSEEAIPPDLEGLPPPVVGLIGQLSERIDLDVLQTIADAGFSLLIVGPMAPRWEQRRFNELVRMPHVRYAGPVPAEAVPSYLAAIDIGITPYSNTPFNRASFPLKTLEYLGAGLPVVSADLPAARWLRADLARWVPEDAEIEQILALARSQKEFVDAIRRIVSGPNRTVPGGHDHRYRRKEIRASQCVAFASRHTWSCRADAFASEIGLP